jgi:4'-phosphopantetheinyl transferase
MKREFTVKYWNLSTNPGSAASLPDDHARRHGTSGVTWQCPPATIELPHGEVHIWRACLDAVEPSPAILEKSLSPDERARAGRFHFDRDKRRFVTGRGLLRAIVGRYLRVEPSQLFFFYGRHGKPRLTPASNGGLLHFNVSHSDELAVYAVTRDGEVGIDVEHIRPLVEAEDMADHVFSTREMTKWRAVPSRQRTRAFFNCWTRKEALLKAAGGSIADSLKKIEVSFAPNEPATVLTLGDDPEENTAWCVRDIDFGRGYIGAIAVDARGTDASHRHWTTDWEPLGAVNSAVEDGGWIHPVPAGPVATNWM